MWPVFTFNRFTGDSISNSELDYDSSLSNRGFFSDPMRALQCEFSCAWALKRLFGGCSIMTDLNTTCSPSASAANSPR